LPERVHPILRRQFKTCFGNLDDAPEALRPFIELVNDAYHQADADRLMLERSLDLRSEELKDANANLRRTIMDLQAAHREVETRAIERTKALESAHDGLRQSTKMQAIGQLAGGVAHDFNNLLTIIGGCAELVLESGRVHAADRADLEEICKATERATALTQQLLAFSRRQVLAPKTVDLNEVVRGSQKMLARVIREDITLLLDSSPGPAWVRVDPNQVDQVILNLVLNAKDAMPTGGRIRLSLSREQPATGDLPAGTAADAGYVCLRVSDNGVGMPPEVRDRVFEPFFTTKESGQGTGLGLASVYGIVRQSNGFISVDSAQGVGTTFTLFFPASTLPDVIAATERAGGPASMHRETVLLVEDEPGVRRVVRAMLQQYGYDVLDAATPAEACAIFDRHADDIELLVTDVVMPEMNGPALAQRLVTIRPALRVLFISGYTAIDPNALGLGHRHVGFLSKPIEASQLAAKVREVFGMGL
jgi:signal transduction histidine kinase/CheY-like chemotaxis protein